MRRTHEQLAMVIKSFGGETLFSSEVVHMQYGEGFKEKDKIVEIGTLETLLTMSLDDLDSHIYECIRADMVEA